MDFPYQLKRLGDLAHALYFSRLLAHHDRWSRQQILVRQQKCLEKLLRHAVAHSEFYRDLYRGINLRERITLSNLPVIDKPTVMANFDRLVTDPHLKLTEIESHLRGLKRDAYYRGNYRALATAGTSGFRGVFVFDRREWGIELANALRWHGLMGVKPRFFPRVKVSAIGADSPIHVSARLTTSSDVGLFRFQLLNVTAPLRELVASLNGFQPDVLLSYPSMAAVLAHEQVDKRLAIRPRVISTHSELLTKEMADKIERAWGRRPFNHYGLTELSTYGAECERHCGMHALDDLFIAEVVDDAFRPVEPGKLGRRILLTNLYNFTQPLIRYDVSDMMALSPEPCACGRPFPLIMTFSGRGEEVLHLAAPDGREILVPPLVISAAIEPAEEVVEFQVRFEAGVLQVRAVARAGAAAEPLSNRLRSQLASRLAALGARPLRIEVEFAGSLDRASALMGKVRLVQSEPLVSPHA